MRILRLTGGISLIVGCLLVAGCQGVHGPHLGRANAPALNEEVAPRDLANPNAPFAIPAGMPHLAKRPALLDISAVPLCTEDQLTLFESQAKSMGPHHTVQFTVANGGEACRLGGFPAVSMLRADGSVLASLRLKRVSPETLAATLSTPAEARPAKLTDAPSPQVLLGKNGEADFQLGWTTGPTCEQVSRIAIATPGERKPVVIARPLVICEDRILVTAIHPTDAEQP